MKSFKIHKSGISLLAGLLFSLSFTTCSDDDLFLGIDGQGETGDFLLTTGSATTRADDGHINTDDPFAVDNEDVISTADLYFFSEEQSSEKAIYHCTINDINKVRTAKLTLKIPIDKLSQFGNSTEDQNKRVAFVYVLVNLPSNSILPDDATVENLKKIEVATDEFKKGVAPVNFVMRGSGVVTLEGDGKDALIKGCIPVERLASKVRLFINIQKKIYLDENGRIIPRQEGESDEHYYSNRPEGTVEEWVPLPDIKQADNTMESNTWLFMNNFTTRGRLDGELIEDLGYANTERTTGRDATARRMYKDLQLVDYTNQSNSTIVDREKFPYTHQLAYYSYPNSWDGNDIMESHASSLTLRLSWERTWEKETGEENHVYGQFYYQIPVNRVVSSYGKKNDRMDPNTYYRVKVDIGMLGSKDLGSPLHINASYEAIPWRNETVDVNIKGRRYLVVNEKEWTMNNTSQISIPFSSSHTVDKVYCYVTYFRYNEIWGTDYESEGYNYTKSEWTKTYEHESTEFSEWMKAAQAKGYPGNHDSEGVISAKVDSDLPDFERILYYKDKYFYDRIYDEELHRSDDLPINGVPNGYKYYVGHEKPFTFQEDYISRPEMTLEGEMEAGWNLFESIYQKNTIYSCDVDNDNHVIIFNHPLVLWKDSIHNGQFMYFPEMKNGRLRDQFSRIEISIKIKHADWNENDMFSEIIHITQYPGMYIEVSHDYGSPRYRSNGRGGHSENTTYNEYVIVNDHHSTSNRGEFSWNKVNVDQMYSFAGSNCNPNMYVIYTTQLSEDNPNYVIGDPRSLFYNCMLTGYKGKTIVDGQDRYKLFINSTENIELGKETAWLAPFTGRSFNWIGRSNLIETIYGYTGYYYENLVNAPNVSKSNWESSNQTYQMSRYYPTDEEWEGGSKEDFIAPAFRIASSFGKVQINYLEPSRRRCAAYQEAGRPAGRWRLPTKAEIEYIAQLSADGKIPILFGDSRDLENGWGTYWSANGKVDVNAKGIIIFPGIHEDDEYAPRCVYDEWYWNIVDEKAHYTPNPLEVKFYWGDTEKDFTQPTQLNRWRKK